MSKGKVHEIAASGFAEGTNERYDRARPSYPAEALQIIHSALTSHPASFPPAATGTSPDRPLSIIEPGSGTGIFSRLLLHPPTSSYPTFNIRNLIAVEPSAGMRAAWDKGLKAKVPGTVLEEISKRGGTVKCVEGGFDDLTGTKTGLGELAADGVIIAQAWHWCADYEVALREIALHLAPSAPLILIWNLESNAPGYAAALRAHYEPLDLGTPQYYRGLWRKCFDTAAFRECYEGSEERTVEWSVGLTEDEVVERLFSKSYLTEAHLNGQARTDFEAEIRRIIREGDKEWIDKDKGIFKFYYNTDIVIMRRKA